MKSGKPWKHSGNAEVLEGKDQQSAAATVLLMMHRRTKVLISDLSPEQVRRIEQRMRPNVASEVGFLANGESLHEVVCRDEQTLRRMHVEPEYIADRIEEIVGKACCVLSGSRDERRGYRGGGGAAVALRCVRVAIACRQGRRLERIPMSTLRGGASITIRGGSLDSGGR